MAYRVAAHSAHPARRGPPPSSVARNALIAGGTLGCLALASAGAALFGGSGLGSPAPYSGSRSALKVALVDPVAPTVAARDARVAVETPASSIAVRRDPPAPVRTAAAAPAPVPLPVPLPLARPTPQAVEAAAVTPLRERPLPAQVLASADPDTTGSLGLSLGEPPHALGYAAFEPSIQQRPVVGAAKPVASAPASAATRANDFIGPVLPANRKLAAQKPARPLTPQEKLWGGPVRLASLTPADAMRGSSPDPGAGLPHAPYDRQTAVYVITDKKVYMPDGSALEAHSGYSDKMDDPRFVHVRMRGATPPHVYDLTMRENLFHGVEAIRLNPLEGESAIFNRDGLLAHPYMLGGNGQSNGCVSFRDYDAFLDAFKAGKISRLAVIARLD